MGENISNAEIIRRADVIWIQTNCIGHNTYYNVIDLVRRYGRKVRYFKYASAVKCAEQVAEEEKKAVLDAITFNGNCQSESLSILVEEN